MSKNPEGARRAEREYIPSNISEEDMLIYELTSQIMDWHIEVDNDGNIIILDDKKIPVGITFDTKEKTWKVVAYEQQKFTVKNVPSFGEAIDVLMDSGEQDLETEACVA